MKMRKVLGFSTLVVGLSAFANPVACRSLLVNKAAFVEQAATSVAANLEKHEQIFTRSRGLQAYASALGPQFVNLIARLGQGGGHWLDSGAGDAIAMRQFLEKNQNSNVTGAVIALQSGAVETARLRVLKDRFLEQIPLEEIQKADLITDVFGPLAYSGHPHLVLGKYFESLKSNGEILIFLGARDEIYGNSNRVITREGRYLTLSEWIAQIPGVRAEFVVDKIEDDGSVFEKWSLRLTRDFSRDLEIPKVEMHDFKAGAPPVMMFQEVADSSRSILDRLQVVKQQVEDSIHKKTNEISFSNFMNSFRSGELSHPLVSSIKALSSKGKWENISAFSIAVPNEIINRSFDGAANEVFSSLAQKWIRYRVNSIDTEKFQFSNNSSAHSLEKNGHIRLITDFYGDFVGELRPDLALQRYLDISEMGGEIYLYLGKEYSGFGAASEVILPNSKRV